MYSWRQFMHSWFTFECEVKCTRIHLLMRDLETCHSSKPLEWEPERLQCKWSDLLTALDDAAAEVAAGFGVNHSGDVLLGHQVCVELFAAFCLFPEEDKAMNIELSLISKFTSWCFLLQFPWIRCKKVNFLFFFNKRSVKAECFFRKYCLVWPQKVSLQCGLQPRFSL